MQFYTSNMLDDVKGKGGCVYAKRAGICLETQGFLDAVNHTCFPSQIVNPGEIYQNIMIYRFTSHQSFSGYPARFPGFGFFSF